MTPAETMDATRIWSAAARGRSRRVALDWPSLLGAASVCMTLVKSKEGWKTLYTRRESADTAAASRTRCVVLCRGLLMSWHLTHGTTSGPVTKPHSPVPQSPTALEAVTPTPQQATRFRTAQVLW